MTPTARIALREALWRLAGDVGCGPMLEEAA